MNLLHHALAGGTGLDVQLAFSVLEPFQILYCSTKYEEIVVFRRVIAFCLLAFSLENRVGVQTA